MSSGGVGGVHCTVHPSGGVAGVDPSGGMGGVDPIVGVGGVQYSQVVEWVV